MASSPPINRKTRFLFTSVPLHGHFWPTLCVAAALSKRVEPGDVTFVGYEDKRQMAAAASPSIVFRALPPLSDELSADLAEQLRAAGDKSAVKRERRAPRVGSTVFPFYEEHMYAPLLAVAEEMAAAAAADKEGGQLVIACEHACLAAHDVAETLGLPLALLWQLPLQYSLAMAGEHASSILRDHARVPVELPGAVLPARMNPWQRLVANGRLRRRQLRVLWDEYVPKRREARERNGAAPALGSEKAWKGDAPFSPAREALPRPVLHVVSGSWLLEPRATRGRALPPGWSLSGPQGVDLSQGQRQGDEKQASDVHHPAVAALLAEAERAPEGSARIVYVAFGTLANFDDRATVEAMARAFVALASSDDGEQVGKRKKKTYVLWSLPPAGQALLPRDLFVGDGSSRKMRVVGAAAGAADDSGPPPAVLVVPRAEQQALLSHPRVALMVSHCGLNSLCEALARGVPLVGWPLFADQFINAQHSANEGVGVVVPDDGADGDGSASEPGGTRRDARAIEGIIRRALADEGMRARARALGERLFWGGRSGAEVAAETVLSWSAAAPSCGSNPTKE